ncbi:MAG: HAD family hydrolase [bacterium]
MSPVPAGTCGALLFDVLHTLVDDSGFPSRYMRVLLEAEGHDVDREELREVYREVTAREFDWETAASEEPFRSIRDRHEARVEEVYQRLEVSDERDIARDTEWLWKQIATSRIYPEVPEVLPILAGRGYRIALISNADEDDPVIQVLLRAGLPMAFETVVTSQGAGAYKPSPRIFEQVLRELDLEPEQVLMVGDSPASDVLGAKRMGIPAVWVNRKGRSFPEGYPEPDAEISDLKGLLGLL